MEELIKKYIKDNNIIGYINTEDIENMFKNLTEEQIYEIEKNFEEDYSRMDIICSIVEEYNYNLAKEIGDTKEIAGYIYGCEFDIMVDKEGKIYLKDLQGAYLGGVDTYENFETIIEASERLEGSFYRDYYGMEIY